VETGRKEYKSIKVKEDVYEGLKKMGVGLSKAVEVLLKKQREEIERKIDDVGRIGSEIAEIMLRHGFFDIKILKTAIIDVEEDGDILNIKGCISLSIPNEEARIKIKEVLCRGASGGEKP
jgi:predicted CopG family antitoxin